MIDSPLVCTRHSSFAVLAEAHDYLHKMVGAAQAHAALTSFAGGPRGDRGTPAVGTRVLASNVSAAGASSAGADKGRAAARSRDNQPVHTLVAGARGTQMVMQHHTRTAASALHVAHSTASTMSARSARGMTTGYAIGMGTSLQKRRVSTTNGHEDGMVEAAGAAGGAGGAGSSSRQGSDGDGGTMVPDGRSTSKRPRTATLVEGLGAGEEEGVSDYGYEEEARIEACVSDLFDQQQDDGAGLAPPPPVEARGADAEAAVPAPALRDEAPATISEGEERVELLKVLPPGGWGLGDVATLYFDGGSRGNPGRAGAGAVLYVGGLEQENEAGTVIVPLGIATNNQSEYVGMISGMRLARRLGVKRLRVRGDSKLAIQQVQGYWKVNKNVELAALAKKLKGEFDSVTFAHVARELNKRADALSNDAMDALVGTPRHFLGNEWRDGLPE